MRGCALLLTKVDQKGCTERSAAPFEPSRLIACGGLDTLVSPTFNKSRSKGCASASSVARFGKRRRASKVQRILRGQASTKAEGFPECCQRPIQVPFKSLVFYQVWCKVLLKKIQHCCFTWRHNGSYS